MKSSNWTKLKSKITTNSDGTKKEPFSNNDKKIKQKNEADASEASHTNAKTKVVKTPFAAMIEKKMRKLVVGVDCEMVGTGVTGKTNALARCSMVDFDGNVLYDKIVQPKGYVTDFRTKYSGIRKSDLRRDLNNVTFEEVGVLSCEFHFSLITMFCVYY